MSTKCEEPELASTKYEEPELCQLHLLDSLECRVRAIMDGRKSEAFGYCVMKT